jgi:hypothetical protein
MQRLTRSAIFAQAWPIIFQPLEFNPDMPFDRLGGYCPVGIRVPRGRGFLCVG